MQHKACFNDKPTDHNNFLHNKPMNSGPSGRCQH